MDASFQDWRYSGAQELQTDNFLKMKMFISYIAQSSMR